MNITVSVEQISKTGNFDANLILKQYKPDVMSRLMKIGKTIHPKLAQLQISEELDFSESTLKRYRNDGNMQNPD